MKETHTEIAYILDRSGSMGSLTEAAITSFNSFLKAQKNEAEEATFTLVLFDDEYLLHADAVPIREVVELDASTYVPRASTALLDAIGRTVDNIGKRLAAMKEDDRPGKVVIAIFTDGMENSSTDYSENIISKMIKHQQDKYNWEFLFLGANQDAIATAGRMNIHAHNSSNFLYSGSGLTSSSVALSRKLSAMRQSGAGVMNEDLKVPLSDIVSEEEGKVEG
ncbi:MAG: hypothetical protein QM496_03140 [Verrucomicrobiota bacterium]